LMNVSQLSEQPVKLAVAGSPEAKAVGLREQSLVNQAEEGPTALSALWAWSSQTEPFTVGAAPPMRRLSWLPG
jgi:hypothetical protein